MIRRILLLSLISLCTLIVSAQKKPLSTSDFASWKRIEHRQISNDGKYVSYELNEQKGDGVLIVHDLVKESDDTLGFGYAAKFSPQNDFIIYKIKPSADSIRAAKKAELKKEEMPKDSLGIFVFASNEKSYYTKVKSFAVAKENSAWAAILLAHVDPSVDTLLSSDSIPVSDSLVVKKSKKEKDWDNLIVVNPLSKTEIVFDHVEAYEFSKNGDRLLINTKVKDSLELSTVIAFNTWNQNIDTIFRDTGMVKRLAIGNQAQYAAFLYSKDTIDEKVYTLYAHNFKKQNTQAVGDTLSQGMPAQFAPSVHGKVYFSDDESKLFFGTAVKPQAEPEDSLLAEEKAKVDVWSWTDKRLQPMQLLQLEKDKKKTFLAVYHVKEKQILQLADSLVSTIRLINKGNGEVALGLNNDPYLRAQSWSAQWIDDFYLVNLKTGSKDLLLRGKERVYLSPDGKNVLWYEQADSTYYAMNVKTKKTINLTQNVKTAFYDVLNDKPTTPYVFGLLGWTKNQEALVYDRYDIWKFDLTGKKQAVNMTQGYGLANKVRLRYVKTNPEEVFLPLKERVILKGMYEESFQNAYYQSSFAQAIRPKVLMKGDYRLAGLKKAKAAEVLIWSTQTVSEYPEVQVSGFNFADPKIISEANPQQSDFNWASTTTVSWTTHAGEQLRGTLYKPEDFDSTKSYPMVVYFYERSSEGIHRHYTPYPSHSIVNKTFYASKGYLVFVPDITYQISYPGQSAYKAIGSGVQYLINTHTYVDAKRIGLQGQSWGGYQIAYLITQTDLFAAAMAGAPVSNMTSAYGGIRWGSGMSRMFQYEHTQSRIGGSLWDKHLQYIENSPIFYAPKVNTPLLMMHNDKDGAVPWYQGIEYFVALRRLDKPVWLLNYNGMKHNIETKYWANRMDLSERMLQFFDHYLKGEQAPEWMIEGLPAIKKGKDWGY